MSDGKRRDKKGRILLTGEYQDAAGRYSYKYTNSMGQRKAVYSWRLTEADVTPPGHKDSKPLREKEKEIQRLLLRGVYAEDM
ncbi:MAG: integrase DNA-binding domain-containing protein, partial [Lachnospiraceae bacterium]|nr:integrase DNA-binding domain-containing protein [Lachnospiraceae bacterium]